MNYNRNDTKTNIAVTLWIYLVLGFVLTVPVLISLWVQNVHDHDARQSYYQESHRNDLYVTIDTGQH